MTRKEIVLLLVMASINFVNIMDFMIMMPLQEFLEHSFHVTPAHFGFLVSSYAFSAFAASMTASFLVDQFDRKKVLLFAFGGLIVGTLGCGLANSYETLLAARIVAGLFGGLISAQGLSIIGDLFPYEKRGRAMGILMSGFSLASIVGVPSGLYMATHFSWQILFLVIGSMGVVVFLLAAYVIPSIKGHIQAAASRDRFLIYKTVLTNRNQQYALLMMVTLIFAHFATIPFIAPYLSKNAGFAVTVLPLMYFFGGLSSLVSIPMVGKLADAYGKHKVLGTLLILSSVPVFLLTHLSPVPLYQMLLVTTLFFILAGGRMIPAQALLTSVVPAEQRGGFMNLNSSLQQLAMGLSAFTGGLIISQSASGQLEHYDLVGYMSIGISLICWFIMMKVRAVQVSTTSTI